VVGVSVARIRGAEIAFAIPAETTDRVVDDQFARGGAIRLGDLEVPAPTELEGTYLMIGLARKGTKLTEEDLKKFGKDERRVVIRGDQIIVSSKGKDDPAVIRLDASQEPPHIDITSTKNGKTEVNYGIYKFENDVLTICATESGAAKDRPKEFVPDEKSMMLTLKKQTVK
jgi:uncharacterized protein (TIGR03067 family)